MNNQIANAWNWYCGLLKQEHRILNEVLCIPEEVFYSALTMIIFLASFILIAGLCGELFSRSRSQEDIKWISRMILCMPLIALIMWPCIYMAIFFVIPVSLLFLSFPSLKNIPLKVINLIRNRPSDPRNNLTNL